MLVTFAGVMGKAGAYGFLRIAVPLFPPSGLVGLALGRSPCWPSADDHRGARSWRIAQTRHEAPGRLYSSISHMGFIVLGIFALNVQGQQGAVLQMVNHGIVVASAVPDRRAGSQDRTGTRDRSVGGGLAARTPMIAGVFAVVASGRLGLPGLNSFVGEFMITLRRVAARAPRSPSSARDRPGA